MSGTPTARPTIKEARSADLDRALHDMCHSYESAAKALKVAAAWGSGDPEALNALRDKYDFHSVTGFLHGRLCHAQPDLEAAYLAACGLLGRAPEEY